jgi:pilus assembly protein CpaC
MTRRRIALFAIGLALFSSRAWARGKTGDDVEDLDSSSSADKGANELNLVVGENKTISALGVKNYSEGAHGIAEIKLTTDGAKFVIVGRKPGTTSLLLINKDGTQKKWVINVFTRSPDAVKREVEQLLQETPGVRVRRVGSRFFIEGGVASKADAERIQRIAALYPGQVESLVVAGSGAADRKINIRIDFFFVQYDKSSGYAVGIDFPGRYGGEVIQSRFGYDFVQHTSEATAAVVNQPLPALDLAQRKGWAKVLKQSTVITVNGTKATFENGGEENFPVTAGLTASIQQISFGTKVTVLPRLDPKTGDLEVQVDADVADLTPAVSGTPLPGRDTSKLDTLVRLKLGQSLVLSGIRTQSRRHSITGLPLLSQIPVLGVFFGSHQDSGEDTEGAVFIIPTAVESVPKPAIEMVNNALSQYEEYSGDVDEVNAYDKRPDQWRKQR